MAEYYLISQLPSLDGISDNVPLPITQERFLELCRRFLSKKAINELEKISLVPSKIREGSSSELIEKWNDNERGLRLALGKIRAEKMKKHFDADNQDISPLISGAVRTAVEIDSPMEAEKYLNSIRLDFLESLRPMDSFSEEYVYYYCLKLKLIERIRKFDACDGEAAYRSIYDSIMNKDRSEVI